MNRLYFTMATLLLTCSTAASELSAGPKFDCTAAETKQYIEQVSYNLFAPSPLSTPTEFKDAFIEKEQKAAEMGEPGAEGCVSIFTDGKMLDDWKDAIDAVKNFDMNISFSSIDGAALKALLDKAKEMAQEQLTKAVEALGEDICALLSTDYLKGLLLDEVNKKYGMSASNLRVADFASEVKGMALDNMDSNVKQLLSPGAIDSEMNSATEDEIAKQRKALWDKF